MTSGNRMTLSGRTGTSGAALALLCAATVVLSGCAPTDPSDHVLAFIANDQTPEDVLPANRQIEGLNLDSILLDE